MIKSWLVVRKEKHVDDKYWVCLQKDDALAIAGDVSAYWQKQYPLRASDTECFGNMTFRCAREECFDVTVFPINVRESGEIQPSESD
jgi:hypothetical protein